LSQPNIYWICFKEGHILIFYVREGNWGLHFTCPWDDTSYNQKLITICGFIGVFIKCLVHIIISMQNIAIISVLIFYAHVNSTLNILKHMFNGLLVWNAWIGHVLGKIIYNKSTMSLLFIMTCIRFPTPWK
jgi:hypothetical protein